VTEWGVTCGLVRDVETIHLGKELNLYSSKITTDPSKGHEVVFVGTLYHFFEDMTGTDPTIL